jgi:NADH-quinone oxidoreductase subunit F
MEEDPFAMIEAMTIAGFAVGAASAASSTCAASTRWPTSPQRQAIAAAREAGPARRRRRMGGELAFDIELRRGAGAYICGEETALFASHRGLPRRAAHEAAVPRRGGALRQADAGEQRRDARQRALDPAARARAASRHRHGRVSGTRLFCVSGKCRGPGLYELPFGATLGELLELAAACSADRRRGAARRRRGHVRGPAGLDAAAHLRGHPRRRATLGSGVVLVLDDTAARPGARAHRRFFRDESCGQCVPCRVGTVRQEELLARLAQRALGFAADELALLADLGRRCATPRSAGSGRRPRAPSPRGAVRELGRISRTGLLVSRLPSDPAIWFKPPRTPRPEAPPRATVDRSPSTGAPPRSPRARRCSTPAAPPESTRRRSASSKR